LVPLGYMVGEHIIHNLHDPGVLAPTTGALALFLAACTVGRAWSEIKLEREAEETGSYNWEMSVPAIKGMGHVTYGALALALPFLTNEFVLKHVDSGKVDMLSLVVSDLSLVHAVPMMGYAFLGIGKAFASCAFQKQQQDSSQPHPAADTPLLQAQPTRPPIVLMMPPGQGGINNTVNVDLQMNQPSDQTRSCVVGTMIEP